MGDRELLERAAKAAGMSLHDPLKGADWNGTWAWNEYGCLFARNGREWSPLTDDGDALRLAVKLRVDIYLGRRGSVLALTNRGAVYDEKESSDPCAATRRAIVRAAAAIAKDSE